MYIIICNDTRNKKLFVTNLNNLARMFKKKQKHLIFNK